MKISFDSLVPVKQNYNCNNNKRSYGNYPNLAPLQKDTVSFGAKKSEFNNFDFAIQKKFDLNLCSDFKTGNDFQNWCNEKLNEYYEKDYSARSEDTTQNIKTKLGEWFNYLKTGNDAYTPAMKLLIVDGITKNLKIDEDNEPPKLNPGALADTMSEIQKKPKKEVENMNFLKLYKNNLNNVNEIKIVNDKGKEVNGNTGWVIIPSKSNDPKNFDKNVEKLKTLSHDNWCTKSFNAEPYLSDGDFHVYLENGEPKIGVRFVGDEVEEIEGENNNRTVPLKYLDIIKSHIEGLKLTNAAKDELKNAEKAQIKINELQQKLGKSFSECTSEELFTTFDMLEKVDDDGLLILKKYKQPDEEFSWNDIGFKENKLFKDIKEIKGYADFSDSEVTNLGNLQIIGGNASFFLSKITDLGNLQTIGGNANFEYSKITDLGNLQTIGGNVVFGDTQITDLGNLQTIGGDADFMHSQVTNLGNLLKIGGDVYLIMSKLKISDFDNINVGGKTNKFPDLWQLRGF